MTNVELVIAAIKAGADHIDAVVTSTGLTKRDVRYAFDHLNATMRIEPYKNAPRTTRYGRPQACYRIVAKGSEAIDCRRKKSSAVLDRLYILRNEVGMFAGLLA